VLSPEHRIDTRRQQVRVGELANTNFQSTQASTESESEMPINATRTQRGRRQFKIRRFTVRTRSCRFTPIIRSLQPPISFTGERLIPTGEPAHVAPALALIPAQEDHSPAARARRVRRKLARRFATAKRAAKGQARLQRADEYALLKCAYLAVRCWRQDGVAEEIERELRAKSQVAISRRSSLFLVLLRSALPRPDPKTGSKWAAALEFADRNDVRAKRLPAFLRNNGGIEGAARGRAKLRG